MTTFLRYPTKARFPLDMPGLRMGFDSMAAWDKTSTDFEHHIQRRSTAYNNTQGRSHSGQHAYPPPFQKATSQWSPPASPTSALSPPSRLPSSLLTTITPPTSPRVDSALGPPLAVSPEERDALATELYMASCAGDLPKISLLLSLGASPNAGTLVKGLYESFKPAKHGHLSPLAGAATNGQLEAANFLISHGAHVNPIPSQSSSAPLHQACRSNDIEMARLLLGAGADINAQNCYKSTPLMYAVKYGSPALVALTLSYYPDLDTPSFMDTTAVHWAVFNGRPEALALLLRAGANPDARMADESTPLHCAVMKGATGMAGILIEYGANVALKDNQERTPIEVAFSNGRRSIVQLLKGVRA
jgi:ankyrin repeat protein